MRYRHVLSLLLILLLIASAGCGVGPRVGSWHGGKEITAPAERKALLGRMNEVYYNLRRHSFIEAGCDVHNSFLDEVDTALTAGLPKTRAALDRLHGVTMRLHIIPDGRPVFRSQGEDEIRTGDQETDSMIRHMISWSASTLTYSLNAWRLFATGTLITPPEPLLSSYKVFRDGAGYRIESIGGIEMIVDSAMRVTTLSTALSDGLTISKNTFRETPGGLVLEKMDLTFPDVKASWVASIQYAEVDGVLLPSKVVVTVDGNLPQLDGTVRAQKLGFTFLLSGYDVVKS